MALCSFQYGKNKIYYQLILTKRKTLEIAVHPDKSIVVKAPQNKKLNEIKEKVKNKVRWIQKQIHYFNQFEPRTPKKSYISGSSHLYLGKRYRLKIEKSKSDSVLLKNGYFYISSKNTKPENIKNLLTHWYEKKAVFYFNDLFQQAWKSFKQNHLPQPTIKIKKMKTRWGSLSSKGSLSLNLDLIQTPKDCIEYVIIHELCHLVHYNHNRDFYNLLAQSLPNWLKLKHKLELALA